MNTRSNTFFIAGLTVLLILGAAIRTIEYTAFASLWLDELFIALNVTARQWDELLTQPLQYNQVAPIGFLIGVKLGTEILGPGEAGLRLFPYVASIVGLVLFWRVSSRYLSPPRTLGALAVFALSPTLIWYSRNVKQYSGDVAVILLLVLLALRFREGREDMKETVVAGLLGGLAILCSQPAVMVAAVLLSTLLIQQLTAGKPVRQLMYLTAGWIAGALVVVVTSLILSPLETREFMQHGWNTRGFLPWGPHVIVLLLPATLLVHGLRSGRSIRPFGYVIVGWVAVSLMIIVTSLIWSPVGAEVYMRGEGGQRAFLPWGAEPIVWLPLRAFLLLGLFVGRFIPDTIPEALVAGIFTILAATGLEWLVLRKRDAVLLYAPVVAALLLAAARILPFSGRVSLYVGPFLLISAFGGIDQVRIWLPKKAMAISSLGTLGLVSVSLLTLLLLPFPSRREEARPVLHELRNRWRPKDIIYVMPSGARALEFYGTPLGLHWEEGVADNRSPRESLREVDALRGRRRAWLFFTHTVPCQQQLIRSYLATIGREVERIPDPYGMEGKSEAAAYLYDLSDPARLSRASASTYSTPDFIAENCEYRDSSD